MQFPQFIYKKTNKKNPDSYEILNPISLHPLIIVNPEIIRNPHLKFVKKKIKKRFRSLMSNPESTMAMKISPKRKKQKREDPDLNRK